MAQAIQDYYSSEYSYCYGCGKQHPSGLHLKSYVQDDGSTVMELLPPSCYTGGVPDNLYGGFIAMLFDCHGTASAAAFYLQHQALEMTASTIERFVTAHLELDFLKPTPMGHCVKVYATATEVTARKVVMALRLEIEGSLYAKGAMVAVRIPNKQS